MIISVTSSESSSDWDGVDAAAIYAKWSKKEEGTKLERY